MDALAMLTQIVLPRKASVVSFAGSDWATMVLNTLS